MGCAYLRAWLDPAVELFGAGALHVHVDDLCGSMLWILGTNRMGGKQIFTFALRIQEIMCFGSIWIAIEDIDLFIPADCTES